MSISTIHRPQAEPQAPRIVPSVSAASTNLVSRKRHTIVQDLSTGNPRKRRHKHRKFAGADIDSNAGLNLALGRLDRYLLADYLSEKTKQYDGSLTSIEMKEKRIPGIKKL